MNGEIDQPLTFEDAATERRGVSEAGPGYVWVTPARHELRRLVRRSALVRRYELSLNRRRGVELVPRLRRVPWIPLRQRGQLAIPIGLWEIWSARSAIQALREDRAPDETQLPPGTFGEHVDAGPYGVVASPSWSVATNALIRLIRDRPEWGVGIYAVTAPECDRLRTMFTRAGLADRLDRPREEWRPGDIAITTLLGDSERAHRRDIHFFWTEATVRNQAFRLPYQVGHAKKFLVRTMKRPPPPLDEQLMRAAFGFRELRLTPSGGAERRVELLTVPLTLRGTAQQFSREALLWNSQQRNRLVKQTLRALIDPQRRGGWTAPLAAISQSIEPGSIAVIVGSDQQRTLLEQAIGERAQGFQFHQYEAFVEGAASDVEVVVRADGRTNVPQGVTLARNIERNAPLIVLDFRDRGPAPVERWTRRRMAAYTAQGIAPVGTPAQIVRMNYFLQQFFEELS